MNNPIKRQDVKVLDEITKQVSLRVTHPTMYRVLMIIAMVGIASAVNLYLAKPTFAPYGLPKGVIASVFLAL